MRTAILLALALVACDKKEAPAASTTDAGGKMAVVDRALQNGGSAAIDQGKGAIVAQQCSIACTARPGIDPGTCTMACNKTCGSEKDLAGIDACASRVAADTPTQ